MTVIFILIVVIIVLFIVRIIIITTIVIMVLVEDLACGSSGCRLRPFFVHDLETTLSGCTFEG